MDLSEIAEIRLRSEGVQFRYLVLEVEDSGQQKLMVRGVNYQPYTQDADAEVLVWARRELEDGGYLGSGGRLNVKGGGSLTLNPYYETMTLFGASPGHGPEENREAVAALFEKAYPGYEISWFDADARPQKAAPGKTPPPGDDPAEVST